MGFVGKNYAYQVEYDSISGHRFLLHIKAKKVTSRSITVIMKNPASTCDNMPLGKNIFSKYKDRKLCHTDRTTTNVYRKLVKLHYDDIYIINLYSMYGKNSKNVCNYYYGQKQNLQMINTNNNKILTYNLPKNIVCAFGSPCGFSSNKKMYDNQINAILNIFQKCNLFEYDNKTNNLVHYHISHPIVYPLHGLAWK